jgi:hypothetical protein
MHRLAHNQFKAYRDKFCRELAALSTKTDKEDLSDSINAAFKNPIIRLLVKVLVYWILKKKGFISLCLIYFYILLSYANDKFSLIGILLQWFVPDTWEYKQKLIDVSQLIICCPNIFVVSIATIVFIFCAVIYYKTTKLNTLARIKVAQETTAQLNFFTFKPNEKWFIDNNDKAIKSLGPRYSTKINFHIPSLSQIYHSVLNDTSWLYEYHDHLRTFLKELQNICSSDIIIPDQTDNLAKIASEIQAAYAAENPDRENISSMARSAFELCCISIRVPDKKNTDKLDRLQNEVLSLENFKFQVGMLKHPIMHILGDAGVGKSHLLADIVTERQKKGLQSILLLGAEFVDGEKTPMEQIEQNLCLTCSYSQWLDALDQYALEHNQRIYIIIDGINEGQGANIWSNFLSGFEAEISQRENLGCIISARTFNNRNMLDEFGDSQANKFTHKGFEDALDEAITYFINEYNLSANYSRLIYGEIATPLFLKTYCEAINYNSGVYVQSLYDIVSCYVKKKNDEIVRELNLPLGNNYVLQTIRLFAECCLKSDNRIMYQDFAGFLSAMLTQNILPPNADTHKFIERLVSNGLFLQISDTRTGKSTLHFNYELVGGYILADVIIEKSIYKLDDILDNQLISTPFSVLFPIITGHELINSEQDNCSYNLEYVFVESLSHRITLTNEAKSYIAKKLAEHNYIVFDIISKIALFDEVEDWFKEFNKWMLSLTLSERDSVWTTYKSSDNWELQEFARKILAFSTDRIALFNSNQVYQIACVLIWMLSLTERTTRDIATKAIVKIYKVHLDSMIRILNEFDSVNDPYIRERLYAAVFGAIMSSKQKEQMPAIALAVYQNIFNRQSVPCDILLRDYARNTIDYICQIFPNLNIDLAKIAPPYNSYSFSENDCPDYLEINKRYKPSEAEQNTIEARAINSILDSMRTERSHRGLYGDFGRYTFEYAVRFWEIDSELVSNYAIQLIFEELNYDAKLFGKFDCSIGFGRARTGELERIGKKYQWIAFHKVLALLTDNIPFRKEHWVCEKYYGTWEPYVRDIDPTSTFINKTDEYSSYDQRPNLSWFPMNSIPFKVQDHDKWLISEEGMSDEIFRNRIEFTDEDKESWIALYSSQTLYERDLNAKLDADTCELWLFAQAYDVNKSCASEIMKNIKGHTTQGRNMPERRNYCYELFNKDYYLTAAYRERKEAYNDEMASTFDSLFDRKSANDNDITFAYEYTSPGEGRTCYRLSEFIFKHLRLADGDREGEYVNTSGIVVAMDISINYHAPSMLLIRKSEIRQYLLDNNRVLIWPLLAEKSSGRTLGNQFGGYAYWDGNDWSFSLEMYK